MSGLFQVRSCFFLLKADLSFETNGVYSDELMLFQGNLRLWLDLKEDDI